MGILDAPGLTRSGGDAQYPRKGAFAAALMDKLRTGRASASILVLSDSTGDETFVSPKGRWVLQMAQRLGASFPDYTVNFRHWNTTSSTYDTPGSGQSQVVQVGAGTANAGGPFVLDVYCGAATGTNPNYAYDSTKWPTLAPAITPELVFINYGHNLTGSSAAQQRVETMRVARQCRAKYPAAALVIVAQNPTAAPFADIAADLLRAQAAVKIAADLRCGLVNVLAAFLARPDYATALVATDGLHPSVAGSTLWADETMKLFGQVGSYDSLPAISSLDTDQLWLPATQFSLHTGTPTLGLVNGIWTGWSLPNGSISGVEATVLIPRHWNEFDTYVHYALASATGFTGSTTIGWRIYRAQQSQGLDLPGNRFAYAPPAMASAAVVPIGPSNGTAYQTQIGVLATQSLNVNGLMGLRVVRDTASDNIAEAAFFRGLLLSRVS